MCFAGRDRRFASEVCERANCTRELVGRSSWYREDRGKDEGKEG